MILLHWLLQNGIGQNVSAGVLAFAAGTVWSKTKCWPLHALHRRHDEHSEHLDRLGRSLIEVHEKLDRLTGA